MSALMVSPDEDETPPVEAAMVCSNALVPITIFPLVSADLQFVFSCRKDEMKCHGIFFLTALSSQRIWKKGIGYMGKEERRGGADWGP